MAEGAYDLRNWSHEIQGGRPVISRAKAEKQRIRQKRKARKKEEAKSDDFLESYAWRKLRYEVLKKRGARCDCCGRTRKDGIRIHVDHIKSRKKHPELALVKSNLQVLCHECNHGKGNWDETDWR